MGELPVYRAVEERQRDPDERKHNGDRERGAIGGELAEDLLHDQRADDTGKREADEENAIVESAVFHAKLVARERGINAHKRAVAEAYEANAGTEEERIPV